MTGNGEDPNDPKEEYNFFNPPQVTPNFWLNFGVLLALLVVVWRFPEWVPGQLPLSLALLLMVAHFLADFRWQSHWMGSNKSKQLDALCAHVLVYTAAIYVVMVVPLYSQHGGEIVAKWALWNGGIHFCVDFWTSRATSKLWFFEPAKIVFEGRYPVVSTAGFVPNGVHPHWFFEMIGFDQLIHLVTLLVTASWWLV